MAEVSLKKIVPVDEAVGMVLPHDITEIVKDEFKGRAFKKGHVIRTEDIEHLRRLGKEHIYVLQLSPEEIHENEAALLMAEALAGTGTRYSPEIVEGKAGISRNRGRPSQNQSGGVAAVQSVGRGDVRHPAGQHPGQER